MDGGSKNSTITRDLHRHAIENLDQADALLFGRVTYEMMEEAFRPPARTGARPDWMEPFARTINEAKKYVVSSTLDQVDWNAELVRGDLEKAVQQLKRESGKGLFIGGVKPWTQDCLSRFSRYRQGSFFFHSVTYYDRLAATIAVLISREHLDSHK
jgi:dihydrofolate reductase